MFLMERRYQKIKSHMYPFITTTKKLYKSVHLFLIKDGYLIQLIIKYEVVV